MVEVVSTSLGVKDTTGISLEVVVGSINGNTGWSSSNSGLQGWDALGFDGLVFSSKDLSFGFLGSAASGFSNVWVSSLKFNGVFLGISEGPDLETNLASTQPSTILSEALLQTTS